MTSTILPGPASTGPAVNTARVGLRILLATDGCTVGSYGVPYAGDGIIVALPEHGTVIDCAHTPGWDELVDEWVRTAAPVVSAPGATPARYFGAWYGPDGHLYLDVVEAYSSADRDLAIAAGRARDQIAVWDAGAQREIPTGGTGKAAAA